MYIYTMQTMPGCKAKFDGDTSVRYMVRRKHTPASAGHKTTTAVIRTDLGYTEATAMVERFNDKERESRSIKDKYGSHLKPSV